MAGKIALLPLICGLVALAMSVWPSVLDRAMDRVEEFREAMLPFFYTGPRRGGRQAAEQRGWLIALGLTFLLLGIFASTL
jgi:hypothetical protein